MKILHSFNSMEFSLPLYSKDKLAEDATISPTGSGFKGFTLSYNARSENEVDYIISKLREKGVKIVKNPQKVFWVVIAVIFPILMTTFGR